MATTFNDIAELNDFMVEQEIIRNTNEKARIEREKTRAELFDKLQTLEEEHVHGEAERQENEKNRQALYKEMLATWDGLAQNVKDAQAITNALLETISGLGIDATKLQTAIDSMSENVFKVTTKTYEHTDSKGNVVKTDTHIVVDTIATTDESAS